MEFFVYHRDRAGSGTMREQLLETKSPTTRRVYTAT